MLAKELLKVDKRGFKNINNITYVGINVSRLQEIFDNFGLTEITKLSLYNEGIINRGDKVKILGNGEISVKLNVNVDAFSATAKSKIEAAGGTINA